MKENNLSVAQFEAKLLALQVEKKQTEVKLEEVIAGLTQEKQQLLGKIAKQDGENGQLQQKCLLQQENIQHKE